MVASLRTDAFVSPAVVGSTLFRLGVWESADDRPRRSVLGQQLELPPSGLSEFTIHRDQPEQLLRFRGCQGERQFWLDLLPHIEADGRRVTRFQQCGGFAFVSEDIETGQLFLQAETCKLRICPVCRRRIQAKASARVLDFMNSKPNARWQFQTYTLKHSPLPLPAQLDRLVKSFRRLRQRALWKSHVQTGYAVIEVNFHPKGSYSPTGRKRDFDEWHPHLHVVAQTDFIPWGPLRQAWLQITGDSDNIDCEPCESSTHAAHYVSKYVGKPPDLCLKDSPSRAAEYYKSLQGRRLLMPFGETNKHKAPPPPPPRSSQRICQLHQLVASAASGCYPAKCMLTRVIFSAVPRRFLENESCPPAQLLLFQRAPPTEIPSS